MRVVTVGESTVGAKAEVMAVNMVEVTVVNMAEIMEVTAANIAVMDMEVMEANMEDTEGMVMAVTADMATADMVMEDGTVATAVMVGMADMADGTVDGIMTGGERAHIGAIMDITTTPIIFTPLTFITAIILLHTTHILIAITTITMHRSITTFTHNRPLV
jgi:hypothetical protein